MVRLSSIAVAALASFPVVYGSILPQVPMQNDGTVRTTNKWDWSSCGTPEDVVDIKSITVSPDPPKPGADLTVTVVGEAKDVIEEGAYADVLVKLGAIKLLNKEFDVCEEARNANASVQCPVKAGEYTVTQTVALPKEIPKAKFNVNVRGYSVDDDDLFCLNLVVDFMLRFPHLGF